jgi:hypothetical protein
VIFRARGKLIGAGLRPALIFVAHLSIGWFSQVINTQPWASKASTVLVSFQTPEGKGLGINDISPHAGWPKALMLITFW